MELNLPYASQRTDSLTNKYSKILLFENNGGNLDAITKILHARRIIAEQHSAGYYEIANDIVEKNSPIKKGWRALGGSLNRLRININAFLAEVEKNPKITVPLKIYNIDKTFYVPTTEWGLLALTKVPNDEIGPYNNFIRRIEHSLLHKLTYTNASRAISSQLTNPNKSNLCRNLASLSSNSLSFAIEGKALLHLLLENKGVDVADLKNFRFTLSLIPVAAVSVWNYLRSKCNMKNET